MFEVLKKPIRAHSADVAMSLIIVVWAVHFIVVKDALSDLPPLTFNAIRFSLGLPVLLIAALRDLPALRIARQDVPRLLMLGLIGPLGYQIGFILGLQRTTSTNTALLIATLPTWTALLSISMGIIMLRRQMIFGVIMSLIGVGLVIVGSSDTGLAISRGDLIGSTLALGAAVVSAVYYIGIKPLVDRYGGTVVAVWTYCITTAALLVIAAPDLIKLTPADLPMKFWPHLFYSGVLSSAFGFLVETYAIHHIGPTRVSVYYNFEPIIAAAAGIAVLGDPLTAGVVAGAALTLGGVMIVRRNTYLRLPKTEPIQTAQQGKIVQHGVDFKHEPDCDYGADAAR